MLSSRPFLVQDEYLLSLRSFSTYIISNALDPGSIPREEGQRLTLHTRRNTAHSSLVLHLDGFEYGVDHVWAGLEDVRPDKVEQMH